VERLRGNGRGEMRERGEEFVLYDHIE